MTPSTPSRSLLEIVLETTRTLDRNECFARIAHGARELFGGRLAIAYQLKGGMFEALGIATADPGLDPDSVRLSLGQLRADAWSVAEPSSWGEPELAEHAAQLSGVGGARLIPLRDSSGPCGLILVLYGKTPPDDDSWIEGAAELTRELEPALQNLKTITTLSELAIRDDTTECYNRRYFEQCLADEVERCRRYGERFALIFLDMDDLKQVNTKYGHTSGSKVLLQVSQRINELIRTVDRLYRYGGDEFTAILPGTDAEGARAVARRIQQGMSEKPFEMIHGEQENLSASTGIAVWPMHGNTPQELVAAADRAMRGVKATRKGGLATADKVIS